jgi:malto-oligosyltrehalose synthase/4-alpha-glucanotransferase
MYNPISTYRVQFHNEFSFQEFESIIPYLQKLGISTIYASPVFASTPGSKHGYDALNPHLINPEIGTLEQLKTIAQRLAQQNIGWLQDIVPNHMAFDTRNPWITDILEKGTHSNYASFFDISWNSRVGEGKLMVPFLGSTLEEVVERRELSLSYEAPRLVLKYFNAAYPVGLATYEQVLLTGRNKVNEAITQLLQKINETQQVQEATAYSLSFNEFIMRFTSSMKDEVVRSDIEAAIETINTDSKKLLQIVQNQVYRPCHWQETDRRINYRRFFTVNGLICLNMQNEEVFLHFHQLIRQLVDEGVFKGLRIDHIDGLLDPTQYLERLKNLVGASSYTVVEKILQPDENIPSDWKVEGNTGYDFLAMVNNLFTNQRHKELFTQLYHNLAPSEKTFEQQLREKKRYILYEHMGGELENLYQLFLSLNAADGEQLQSIPPEYLKEAIGEFLIHCPVYRYYGNVLPLQAKEAKAIIEIIQGIKQTKPELTRAVDLLGNIFLQTSEANKEDAEKVIYFYQRCMQFSGPLMAKGFEDTLMYTFSKFIAHNEVGDSPDAFGYTIEAFHLKMKERQKRWPLSINTSSTHDTKRGEDVRARLNVLPDLAPLWVKNIEEWMEINKGLKNDNAPDNNDEYLIYQVLTGHYPMPGEEEDDFKNRLQEYLQKALREAKTNSNWTTPNERYETATKEFAVKLLDSSKPFWKSFQFFKNQIVDFGIINSLIQVLLKFTCPGVPDVYQGTELWDLSFVDPDNRRAVDYEKRIKFLTAIENTANKNELITLLWRERYNGKVKLWLTQQLFALRKQHATLFSEGEYVPLKVKGRYKENIIAFARRYRQILFIIAAPLHLAALCGQQNTGWQALEWADTQIDLPPDILPDGELLLQDQKITLFSKISPKDIFRQTPFAVLKGQLLPNKRGAGILLHVSSLPSPFGIGDLGPAAYYFADFLFRSYQKYWQLLPLNPTEAGQGYSPYSATSSRAGNVLFISPEVLAEEDLLNAEELGAHYLPPQEKTDYKTAGQIKEKLLDKAWSNFKKQGNLSAKKELEQFSEKEKEWLDDFALYMILKNEYNGKPWYEWPEEFKFRDHEALDKLTILQQETIEKIKWLQFVFAKQWHNLKTYCNNKNIQLIGDLPFYVSYDSADVWGNAAIFKLDGKGNKKGVAGVPPDAFSDDGQLWGMPVFRWDVLKKDNYRWWIERLKKNTAFFDLVRLDHFRAFSAYWEVAATEKTAKKGQWLKGPGKHFLDTVKSALGELPFLAEDLGEIDEPVYNLRDAFQLPGMKVLQFAFGEDMGTSPHIPHNYKENFIAYTGTHDNNTTRGWWTQSGAYTHGLVEAYAGRKLTEEDVPLLFCRLAYASTARIAILPLQDILGLDETARMNTPSSAENNWLWRLVPGQLKTDTEINLKEWTKIYNRQ